VEKAFATIVGWGRFGQIFGYDASSEEMSLDEPEATPPAEAGTVPPPAGTT
jgi:hypothetical protein